MRIIQILLFTILSFYLKAQASFTVYDSATMSPLAGVSVVIYKYPNVYYSDIEGKIVIPHTLTSRDTLLFSALGYERKFCPILLLPYKIFLAPRKYILPTTTIKPIEPREYIKRSFDSFYLNHIPKPFSQRVFYREEFIVNDHYARFQEMDIEVYQFPKTNDNRKYYISGSYPKIHNFYKRDDSFLMKEIKISLGKIIGNQLNFNYLSGYSYVKGVNMLNFIYTHLLESKEIQYKYLGTENVKGHQALHIQGRFFQDKVNYSVIDVFIEENTFAVLHISIQATDENLTKQFLDFKTRTLLWFLGIKVNVKKYYSKMQFSKNSQGFWSVDDFMLMLPVTIHKKKNLVIYLNIGYRMSPQITIDPKPLGYSVYQENQHLFDTQKTSERFSEKLNYSIPFLPAQLERLNRMRLK